MKITAPENAWSAPVALGTEAFEQIDIFNTVEGGPAVRIRWDDPLDEAIDVEASPHDYCPPEAVRRAGFPTARSKRRISLYGVGAAVDCEVIGNRASNAPNELISVRSGPTGAQGIQGDQGPQGDAGPAGADGAAGVDGVDGADAAALFAVFTMDADQLAPVVGQHVQLNTVTSTAGVFISTGADQANGIITIPEGYTGKLCGQAGFGFSNSNGEVEYRWRNTSTSTLVGTTARVLATSNPLNQASSGRAVTAFDTTAGAQNFKLEVTVAQSVSSILSGSTSAEI